MIFQYHNTSLFYNVYGKGPSIVLLHGFLESSVIWDRYVNSLSQTNTVLCVDLPGHGASDSLHPVNTMNSMAIIINTLLQYLKMNQVTLLGHSMGGYVCLSIIELFPERVAKIILLNSTTFQDSEQSKVNRNKVLKIIKTHKTNFINRAIESLFLEQNRNQFRSEIEQLKTIAHNCSKEAMRASIIGMRDRKDQTNTLKNFKKKKLIISGELDSIIKFSDAVKFSKLTDSRLKKVSGGHMCWLENFNEINKELLFVD